MSDLTLAEFTSAKATLELRLRKYLDEAIQEFNDAMQPHAVLTGIDVDVLDVSTHQTPSRVLISDVTLGFALPGDR